MSAVQSERRENILGTFWNGCWELKSVPPAVYTAW